MLAFSNDYYGMIFRATQSVELFCAYVCLSDIMRKTKEEYMGRIMGFVSMITNMFQPISQVIYGRGLEYTISGFGKFLIVIAVSILGISLYRKNVIKRDKK